MNMLRCRYLPSGLALIALIFLLQVTPVLAAQNPNPGVLPPDSHPFGKTYGEWNAGWWQWFFSVPASKNPGLLTTEAVDCSVGQSGNDWFLAGRFNGLGRSTHSCTVPVGKALVIPLINSWQDNAHSILDHFVDGNFHTFLQLCAGPGESQTDLFRSVRFWSVICRSDLGW